MPLSVCPYEPANVRARALLRPHDESDCAVTQRAAFGKEVVIDRLPRTGAVRVWPVGLSIAVFAATQTLSDAD